MMNGSRLMKRPIIPKPVQLWQNFPPSPCNRRIRLGDPQLVTLEHTTSVRDRLLAGPQYLLPHHALAQLMYGLTRLRRPAALKNAAIRAYVRFFDIDLTQAEPSDPQDYPDFNSFFTRALKPGARSLALGPQTVMAPVDGTLSQFGRITQGRLLQAKGRDFSVHELLGGSTQASAFRDGAFMTLYLSPRDYHRVHMPVAGTLEQMIHVPGRLFSVNAATTRVVPRLFARNERVICLFRTAQGPLAVVLVGALMVGSMQTTWAGQITPPYGAAIRVWDYRQEHEPPQLAQGAELGRFNLGSTVILLFGPDQVRWEAALAPLQKILMGQRLGTLAAAP